MPATNAAVKLVRNWLHQSISYLDRGERRVRVAFEILEIAATGLTVGLIAGSLGWSVLIISVIAVHSVNWVGNGNFWVLLQSVRPSMRNRGPRETLSYLEKMRTRLSARRSVSGLLVLGSIAKGRFTDRSDIDMRIVRRPGFGNLLATALLSMRERLYALLLRQPLDIYLADDPAFLDRMRFDEQPIFLIKRDPRLDDRFPDLGVAELSLHTHMAEATGDAGPKRVACLLPGDGLSTEAKTMKQPDNDTGIEFWPIGSSALTSIGPRKFLRLMRRLDKVHPDFVLTHDNRSRRLARLMRLTAGTSHIPLIHICTKGEHKKVPPDVLSARVIVVTNKRDAYRMVAEHLATGSPGTLAETRCVPASAPAG